jgi:hypothetical protein
MKKLLLFFLFSALLTVTLLVWLDRFFFKNNDGFCIRHIYSSIANKEDWDVHSSIQLTSEELK